MILLIVIIITATVIIVIVIIVIVIIVIVIIVIVIIVLVILVIVCIISNVSNSIENNVYVDSSVCKKVFNFLLGGRSINNSIREWKDLFKCQMKLGAYSYTPSLVVTMAFFQSIIPIAWPAMVFVQ